MSAMRVTDPHNMPYMSFEPAPTEPEITVQQPGLSLGNINSARITSSIAAIHHTQQATMRRRVEVRAQQVERSRRRDQRAPAATPTTAGQPAAGQPATPDLTITRHTPRPPDFLPNETVLDRQRRTRPQAPAPVIWDQDYKLCPICLGEFTQGTGLWRLQRSHQFHARCWEGMSEHT